MKLFFFFVSLSAVLACGTQPSDLASSIDPNDRPFVFIRDLGRGFNTLTESEAQKCVVGSTIEKRQLGEWESIPFQRVKSREELYRLLGLSVVSSYDSSGTRSQLQNLASIFSFNEKSAVYIMGKYYLADIVATTSPQLGQAALELTEKKQFLAQCGDRFVGGVKYGYGAVGVLKVPASSQADYDEVVVAMADEENRATFLENRAHVFKTYMRGVRSPFAGGYNELQSLFTRMSSPQSEELTNGFDAVELRSSLVDYHLLDNWQFSFEVKQDERRALLKEMIKDYNSLHKKISSIEYLRDNSGQFSENVYTQDLGIQNSLLYARAVHYQVEQSLAPLSSMIDDCRTYDKQCARLIPDEVVYVEPVWDSSYVVLDPEAPAEVVVTAEDNE